MPRNAINYNNTTIYKLCCNDITIKDIYVGHTTNFIKRKANHKKSTNTPTDPLYDTYKYQFIRNNGGFDNWAMIEIIKISCADFNDACRVERQYMEQLNATLNKNRPISTPMEKAENMKVCNKIYYEKNKDKIIEQGKKKLICDCCSNEYTKYHRSHHFKTIKHKKNALSIEDSTDGESSE